MTTFSTRILAALLPVLMACGIAPEDQLNDVPIAAGIGDLKDAPVDKGDTKGGAEAETVDPRTGKIVKGDWVLVNSCGNQGTTPVVTSAQVVSPTALVNGAAPQGFNPSSGRMERSGIQYTSGNGLRFELATDGCTYVKEVKLGAQVITPNYTNGYWYSSQASSSLPTNTGATGYNLWVFYPPQGNGASDMLTVTFGRTFGSGTATYNVPIVQVKEVNPRSSFAQVSITRAEMMNMFAKSLYAKFNGATNSAWIKDSDGDDWRIYGYEASSLGVDIGVSYGISFGFAFKLDVPGWCDPRIYVSGSFDLSADLNGIGVDWRNAPHASAQWPTGCSLTQVIPGVGLIPAFIYSALEAETAGSIRSSIEESIAASVPTSTTANLFYRGSTVRSGEVLVNLGFDVPAVTFRPAYNVFEPGFRGVWFPGNEVMSFTATGLGMNDYVANVSPQTTLWTGAAGVPLFNWDPTPRLQTLARATALNWTGKNVGQLLIRPTNQSPLAGGVTTAAYSSACSLATGNPIWGPYTYYFGANDTVADAQRLRGIFGAAPGYSVRVNFLSDGPTLIAQNAPRCQTRNTGGVIGGGVFEASP